MVKKTAAYMTVFLIVLGVVFCAAAEELTARMCREKVIAAVQLIEGEGRDAFDKIRDSKGEFRFGGGQGYIWIQDLYGTILMHPIASHLDGKGVYNLRDENGVFFFMAFNAMAEENGAGWVSYRWPKPGETKSSPKISYVKLARYGDERFVVGAGIYDVTPEKIRDQFPSDPVAGN